MRQLFGSPRSPFVRKVRLALELKQLSYELVPVSPLQMPDEVRAFSPLGKIPAYRDDAIAICDSTVICQYLDDRFPDVPLYPRDPASAARARWLEEYADTRLFEVLGPPLFFERYVKPRFLQQETDEARVQHNLEHHVPPVMQYLEGIVDPERFVVGDSVSVADLTICSLFVNARAVGFEVDPSLWSRLDGYLRRLAKQPVIAERIEADLATLAS